MLKIESPSARLGLAAEHPDRKRDRRADTQPCGSSPVAEGVMSIDKSNPVFKAWRFPAGDAPDHPISESSVRAAPAGYISTKTAILEAAPLEQLDVQDALITDLQPAIVSRQLVAYAWRRIEDEQWHELSAEFWQKTSGFDSIGDGVVCHLALPAESRRLAGAPLYFERPAWEVWLAAWKAKQSREQVSDGAASDRSDRREKRD